MDPDSQDQPTPDPWVVFSTAGDYLKDIGPPPVWQRDPRLARTFSAEHDAQATAGHVGGRWRQLSKAIADWDALTAMAPGTISTGWDAVPDPLGELIDRVEHEAREGRGWPTPADVLMLVGALRALRR